MSSRFQDFQTAILLRLRRFQHYPNKGPELTTVANALASDTNLKDRTINTPIQVLLQGFDKSLFTNAILHVVNKGKALALTPSDMANAIAGLTGPPTIITPPAITGTGKVGQNLTANTGTWQYFPNSYLYQWRRDGAKIVGGDGTFDGQTTMYALVGADQNRSVTCQVTAINGIGADSVESNAISVT